MAVLKELISSIQYDSMRGIWAEVIDGKFMPDSQARYGERQFENGGLLDDFKFFSDGQSIQDNYSEWCGNFEFADWEEEKTALEKLFCEDGTEFGGNIRELKEWVKNNEDRDDVHVILESARGKWKNQCLEMADEWINQIIEEINQEQE